MITQPSLFISHGAPTLAFEACPAQRYLRDLGQLLDRPDAIVVISAHHNANGVAVTSDTRPETIYDFGGFTEELYQIRYPAPGSSALAAEIVELARENGFEAGLQADRGFDHGAWIPLHLIYPAADIPVVQVSISMRESPRWHFQLGEMLAPLREKNVLIIGSGSLTHNLSEFFRSGFHLNAPREGWVSDFAGWIARKIREGDVDAVLGAVNIGPSGRRNHPTMDHIHPLFVALGAGDFPPRQPAAAPEHDLRRPCHGRVRVWRPRAAGRPPEQERRTRPLILDALPLIRQPHWSWFCTMLARRRQACAALLPAFPADFLKSQSIYQRGPFAFESGGEGRQRFSVRGITEENRASRIDERLPALCTIVDVQLEH